MPSLEKGREGMNVLVDALDFFLGSLGILGDFLGFLGILGDFLTPENGDLLRDHLDQTSPFGLNFAPW